MSLSKYERDAKMTEALAIFIVSVMAIPVAMALSWFWGGFVLSVVWGWFVVPVFMLPTLSTLQAASIFMVVSAISGDANKVFAQKDKTTTLARILGGAIFGPAIVLFFSWVLKTIM